MAVRDNRVGGTLTKVAGRMGCGKVKHGGDNASQRKGGERRARWRDRYQGRGDVVEGVGGVGDVDGGPRMAGVARMGCGKVNDGEHSASSTLDGGGDEDDDEGKRRGGVGTQRTGTAVLGE